MEREGERAVGEGGREEEREPMPGECVEWEQKLVITGYVHFQGCGNQTTDWGAQTTDVYCLLVLEARSPRTGLGSAGPWQHQVCRELVRRQSLVAGHTGEGQGRLCARCFLARSVVGQPSQEVRGQPLSPMRSPRFGDQKAIFRGWKRQALVWTRWAEVCFLFMFPDQACLLLTLFCRLRPFFGVGEGGSK